MFCLLERWFRTETNYLDSTVAAWTAVASTMDWKYFKATGLQRGAEIPLKSEEDGHSMESISR